MGDPLTGYPVHSTRGYVILAAPTHPLAAKSGRVRRHRVVLHDALGNPDRTACQWCGYVLPWKSEKNGDSQHIINVDHLNSTPGDDRRENLVPSCWWCNITRSWCARYAPAWWTWLPRGLAQVPPWNRPSTLDVLCVVLGVDWIDSPRAV